MIKKAKPLRYLDVTKPNSNNKYYIIPARKRKLSDATRVVEEVDAEYYENHPEKFMSDDLIPIQYTGWRKKKKNKKSKPKRRLARKMCKCGDR
jgi:hypothetical protein